MSIWQVCISGKYQFLQQRTFENGGSVLTRFLEQERNQVGSNCEIQVLLEN
jgi:hypothetical protein